MELVLVLLAERHISRLEPFAIVEFISVSLHGRVSVFAGLITVVVDGWIAILEVTSEEEVVVGGDRVPGEEGQTLGV